MESSARDTKLGRDVAIKVLPEAFARDAERMARFQREAKVLASLDHPNIASIYGLEDSGSTRALVMQLAEKPTVADRIKSGPIGRLVSAPGKSPNPKVPPSTSLDRLGRFRQHLCESYTISAAGSCICGKELRTPPFT